MRSRLQAFRPTPAGLKRAAQSWALGLVLSTSTQGAAAWAASPLPSSPEGAVRSLQTEPKDSPHASGAQAPTRTLLAGGYEPIAHQEGVMNFLLAYGLGSVALGGGLWAFAPSPWREVGMQAVAWGGIDAALGQWGRVEAQKKALDPKYDAAADAAFLKALFGWNALLDVGYVAGGAYLATRPGWQGHGYGIMAQGLFLVGLDSSQWWAIPPAQQP